MNLAVFKRNRCLIVKPPCMIVVQYVLPTLRALVMKDLIEEHGMRKIDVSKRMELTPAAITQYIKGDRGGTFADRIVKSKRAMKVVSDLAEALAKGSISAEDTIGRLCEACSAIRADGIMCAVHKEEAPGLRGSSCGVCGSPDHLP
jgi:predicted transcriptional regulator